MEGSTKQPPLILWAAGDTGLAPFGQSPRDGSSPHGRDRDERPDLAGVIGRAPGDHLWKERTMAPPGLVDVRASGDTGEILVEPDSRSRLAIAGIPCHRYPF